MQQEEGLDGFLGGEPVVSEDEINENEYLEPQHGAEDISVSERFVRAFSSYSYDNVDYAHATFHMIVGQILKNQRIMKGGTPLDPRISVFAMWGPSGGKSAALDMVNHVSDKVGLRFVSVDEATDAALLGTVEEKREGKETYYEVVPGFLGACDVLHYDEAEMLFRTNNYSQNTKSYFQKALNPMESKTSIIRKKLAHGEWIQVRPTCSLYLTSYLPSSFEEAVMGTGFFQRILVVPKRLTVEQRRANSMRDIDMLGQEPPEIDVARVVMALRKLKQDFTEPQEWDFSKVKPLLRNRVDRYYSFMNAINTGSRELILGFVPRYQNMLYSLSLHNAALRGDTVISMEDVNKAHALVYDLLRRIVTLIETKTQTGKEGAREDKRLEAAVMQALHKNADEDGWAGIQSIISAVQKLWRVSNATASEMVESLVISAYLEERRDGPARFIRLASK